MRYEFLEMLVRVAYDKYYRSSQKPTVFESVQELLQCLSRQLSLSSFHSFRESYFCEDVDLFFKANKQLIQAVHKKYSGRKTLPGKKKFMSLEEFRELCLALGSLSDGSTTRDVDQAFCFAMMTQIDELYVKRHVEMGQVEFYEALARVSEFMFSGNRGSRDSVGTGLIAQKLQCLLPLLGKLVSARNQTTFSVQSS